MDISILLTTYNRHEECMLCLDSLKPQISKNIELLLLDDFHIASPQLLEYCNNNNFKYIHTGIQKNNKPKWRVPGFALNIGAKLSKGKVLILGNAELYHVSLNTLEQMKDKQSITQPRIWNQPGRGTHFLDGSYKNWKVLCDLYPWFMGVPRDKFFEINGYDEDFIGYAWEDTDLSSRLSKLIGEREEIDADAIHLWNQRGAGSRPDAPNLKSSLLKYNKDLYYKKLGGDIVRNKSREWGIL